MSNLIEYPREFKAVFCPACGECVNQPDEIMGPEGEEVNCGWCKKRHSIDHVKACRRFAHLSERQRMDGARASLLKLRERLSKIVPVFTNLAFDIAECDELLVAIDERRQRVEETGGPTAILWSLHTAVAEARTELKRNEERLEDGLHDGVSAPP